MQVHSLSLAGMTNLYRLHRKKTNTTSFHFFFFFFFFGCRHSSGLRPSSLLHLGRSGERVSESCKYVTGWQAFCPPTVAHNRLSFSDGQSQSGISRQESREGKKWRSSLSHSCHHNPCPRFTECNNIQGKVTHLWIINPRQDST